MRLSELGIRLLKEFESCRLKAYPDDHDPPVWTIGWGHTRGVRPGDICTQAQADAWMVEEVAKFESQVDFLVKIRLTQDKYDSLVLFEYNTGALNKATLLHLLNVGDYVGAAGEFDKWIHAGKRISHGLIRRRAAEKALFLGDYTALEKALGHPI